MNVPQILGRPASLWLGALTVGFNVVVAFNWFNLNVTSSNVGIVDLFLVALLSLIAGGDITTALNTPPPPPKPPTS